MKTDFLKGLGLEQDVIDKIMAENGKDIAAEKAKTTKAEGERDNFKDQLATATASLEKFKDVDPTAMQKAVMAMLDMDALKASKNQSEDIKKALETVKESDAYLFGSDEPFMNAVGATGGGAGVGGDNLSAIRAAMGLPAEKK